MKKFKYYLYKDIEKGSGEGETLIYINAESETLAKEKLKNKLGFKYDPYFIRGGVKEVKEFTQPKKIKII